MQDNCKPIRILQVVTAMNRGGAETMIMNYYRALDKIRYQFDFLVHRDEKADYDDEIKQMGGRIYYMMPIRPWTYFSYFAKLDKFFSEHARDYIAVHGHIQENSGFALYYARKHGIVNLVSSSHIADLGIDYKYLFRQFAKIWTNKFATQRLACGVAAGRFLYGKRDFKILNNAISSDKYAFNPVIRQQLRKELGISTDAVVIGNVARFCPQKNHSFILTVFAEVLKCSPNAYLVLVGEGPLFNDCQSLAIKLGVKNNVKFLGLRDDIDRLLNVFDIFFMPSLFEGLPVSAIEAQANGMPCVLSDTVDSGCDLTGNVIFVSLKAAPSLWAKILLENADKMRRNTTQDLVKAGYDVNHNLAFLLSCYGIN